MARALADDWRVRVLSEVSIRPLSPSRFVDEVGGELTHISRCFRQLAEWGYIEVVEERPGRRRGASIEHIYRAIRRVHFDTATWEGIPRTSREAVSRSTLSSYFERVSEAVDTGTFDIELNRHLSWDEVALDRQAWAKLGKLLDETLAWQSELEVKASKRLARPKVEPIPTIVSLLCFRSPRPVAMILSTPGHRRGPSEADAASQIAIGPKMAKALANRWRCRILTELSRQPLSPSHFIEQFGGSTTHIARCFRELAEWGYIEIMDERRGGRHGGGVERIYRIVRRPYFDTPAWETLPLIVREEISQYFLDTYKDRIVEAINRGTFDAEVDRHLSWKPTVLDRPAWNRVANRLDKILSLLPKLEEESIGRVGETTDDLIPTVVGLTSFRMPRRSAIGSPGS
jgi:DNA-binding transcriptional regulator GbsR (MarR family)